MLLLNKESEEKVIFIHHFFAFFFFLQIVHLKPREVLLGFSRFTNIFFSDSHHLDWCESADSKYGFSFTLSRLVQRVGKKDPRVKKTSS